MTPVPPFTELARLIAERMSYASAGMQDPVSRPYATMLIIGCVEDADILSRHKPVACGMLGCETGHLICDQDRQYSWENCPEVESIWNRYAPPVILAPKHRQTGPATCACGYNVVEAARDLTIGVDKPWMLQEHIRRSNAVALPTGEGTGVD